MSKSLIVYYSRSGNTRFVAEKIAENLKANVEEIVDKKKRSGIIGWIRAGKDATQKKETEIGETKYSPSDYSLIILGSPVWNGRVPPAMRTYLNQHDLSRKKIALFNTSDSKDNTFPYMKELAKNQNPVATLVVHKPLKNKDEAERLVGDWCNELITRVSS